MSSPESRPTEPPGATDIEESIVAPEAPPPPVEPQRAPPADEEPDDGYEPV